MLMQLMKRMFVYTKSVCKVERPEKCNVKYLDYDGQEKEGKAEGLLLYAYNMKLIT